MVRSSSNHYGKMAWSSFRKSVATFLMEENSLKAQQVSV